MTGDLYKDVDVPFCCKCSRFMVIYVGMIIVLLNHESDHRYIERVGHAYKCPQCANIVIYKWTRMNTDVKPKWLENFKYWYIFLEDHKHYNKKRGWKGPQSKTLTVSSIKRSSLS